MALNAGARPVRILVGGVDFSPCFISYAGARSTADTSGLLSITGNIELQYIAGQTPEDLDDRSNSRWCRGQRITLEIMDESGAWARFPHGALRIIKSEFDGRGRLKLGVGDLIAYGSRQEPTDYRDAGISPPGYSTATAIANRLLAKLGQGPLADGLGSLRINYPINIGQNYWETIGKLAFSSGGWLWVDRFENIRTARFRTSPGAAALAYAVGQDEIDYTRLSGAQRPPDKLIVTGTNKVVTETQVSSVTTTTSYGRQYQVGLTGPGEDSLIVLREEQIEEQWDPDNDRRTTQTTVREPRGFVDPDTTGSRVALVVSDSSTEVKRYEPEGNGDTDSGKLLTVSVDRQLPRIFGISGYEENGNSTTGGWSSDPFGLISAEREETRWIYDPDTHEPLRRLYTKQQTAASLLPSEDWNNNNGTIDGVTAASFRVAEDGETEWVEVIPEAEWEEAEATRTPAALNSKIESGTFTLEQKLALTTTVTRRRASNNGVRPPSPDRRPPKYSVTDQPYKTEVDLPQRGCTDARPVTLNIPYLPGKVGTTSTSGRRRRVVSFGQNAWPRALGRQFGALLHGRYQGSEIALPYRDDLTNLEPLDCIEVTERRFDGTTVTRAFLADGDAYSLVSGENRCGIDLVWVGDRTGVTQTVTTTNPDGTTSTQTVDAVLPPYSEPKVWTGTGQSVGLWGNTPIVLTSQPQVWTAARQTGGLWGNTPGGPPSSGQVCWDGLTAAEWDGLTAAEWDGLATAACVGGGSLSWDGLTAGQWDGLTAAEWDGL